jgi:polyisoprenoid-binding protein YceI
MKKITVTLLSFLLAVNVFAQTKWTADAAHSSVRFTVTHMMISEVEGKFTKFDGIMTSAKPDFSDAQIEFTVDVSSINTDNQMRDNHLKSKDFFAADSFPQMKFKSTSIKKVSDKKYTLEGDLTIRDVTKHVTFDVTYGGTIKDGYGNTKAGFKAVTTINRMDYHLNWNKTVEAGAVVSSDVEITVSTEFVQGK